MMSNPAFKFDHVHIISNDPEASANWYVEMFGATITANTTARGAPQIFVDLRRAARQRRQFSSRAENRRQR
jgi:catechol 2,3-dioxygenase-like lactoylglutathione lyase family enzyme